MSEIGRLRAIRNILVIARRKRAKFLIEQEPDSHYSAVSIKRIQDEIDAVDRAISDEKALDVSGGLQSRSEHTVEGGLTAA